MAKRASYTRIIARITSVQLGQRNSRPNANKRNLFTRSDLLLNGEQWRRNIILKVSEVGECDSKNGNVRKQSIKNLKQEIDWAKHVDTISCVLVTLKDEDSCNLARQLLDNFDHSGCVLAEIPITDKSFFTEKYTRNCKPVEMSMASTNIWQRWNKFRLSIEFNKHFKVCFHNFT